MLAAAIVLALLWANIAPESYESFWHTDLTISLGHRELSLDLQEWINSGLMTLFFLVVGLEARREFDLGDLRERRRFVLPLVAGVAGMVAPVLIYLAFNHGGEGAHGWGVAMSTDTALALGLLALVGRGVPDRVRVFLLTVFVVDDLIALLVIAIVYSENIELMPLMVALVAFAGLLVAALLRVKQAGVYVAFGIITWAALLTSGVDPVVAGLAIGLTASAYSPGRDELEQATGLFRLFREQPTPELARSATVGLTSTLSPNARLQHFYHPWTSYLIVPLFGLANAITIDMGFLATAYTSPITLGILVGYVVGKPIAVTTASWALTRISGGRLQPGRRLGRGGRQRHDRRYRLHRVVADSNLGLRGACPHRGEARAAVGGDRGVVRDLDRVPHRRAALSRPARPSPCSVMPSNSWISAIRSIPSSTTSVARNPPR